MIDSKSTSSLPTPYEDYGDRPVTGGDQRAPVSRSNPCNPLAPSGILALPPDFSLPEHTGLMPDDWFLEAPGTTPYPGITPKEAEVIKQMENLFYASFCMVLAVNDIVNATTTNSLKVKKHEINEQMNSKMKEIKKKYKALRKQKKMGLISKIMRWAAVALTAVAAVAMTVLTAGAAAPAAAVLFALTLTVAIMEETGGMDKLTKGVAKMLKKMGVDEKKADMVAGILVAVTVCVVMIAATVATGGSACASAAAKVSETTMRAARIAQKAAEATQGAIAVTDGAATIVSAVSKSDELKSKARLNEINAQTKSFEQAIDDILSDIEEAKERAEDTKKLLTEAMEDLANTLKTLVNDIMGHNGGASLNLSGKA